LLGWEGGWEDGSWGSGCWHDWRAGRSWVGFGWLVGWVFRICLRIEGVSDYRRYVRRVRYVRHKAKDYSWLSVLFDDSPEECIGILVRLVDLSTVPRTASLNWRPPLMETPHPSPANGMRLAVW
jgi:hypothetical protein